MYFYLIDIGHCGHHKANIVKKFKKGRLYIVRKMLRCMGSHLQKSFFLSAPLYRHWGSVQAVRPIGGVKVQLYSFMTTALEGGEGSASRPGRSLPPGKTRSPLYRRVGGPQGRSGKCGKSRPPPGFDLRTVQPVASRYTDWATGPPIYNSI
jgi:hypothetical protein